MPVNRFHDQFPTRRLIRFQKPMTAKALFYALLYLDRHFFPPYCQNQNLILMLGKKMTREFPPLLFVKGLLGFDIHEFSDFPFHMLYLSHRIERNAPEYDEWIANLEGEGIDYLPDLNPELDAEFEKLMANALKNDKPGFEKKSTIGKNSDDIEPSDNISSNINQATINSESANTTKPLEKNVVETPKERNSKRSEGTNKTAANSNMNVSDDVRRRKGTTLNEESTDTGSGAVGNEVLNSQKVSSEKRSSGWGRIVAIGLLIVVAIGLVGFALYRALI